jgi:hypothetical protein
MAQMRSKAPLLGPEPHSFIKILSVTSRQGVRRRLKRISRRRLALLRPIRQVARQVFGVLYSQSAIPPSFPVHPVGEKVAGIPQANQAR